MQVYHIKGKKVTTPHILRWLSKMFNLVLYNIMPYVTFWGLINWILLNNTSLRSHMLKTVQDIALILR